MPIVLKSGTLNLLEPSGPVQASNGIALTFNFQVEDGFVKKSKHVALMFPLFFSYTVIPRLTSDPANEIFG